MSDLSRQPVSILVCNNWERAEQKWLAVAMGISWCVINLGFWSEQMQAIIFNYSRSSMGFRESPNFTSRKSISTKKSLAGQLFAVGLQLYFIGLVTNFPPFTLWPSSCLYHLHKLSKPGSWWSCSKGGDGGNRLALTIGIPSSRNQPRHCVIMPAMSMRNLEPLATFHKFLSSLGTVGGFLWTHKYREYSNSL